jgi:hypothetical protein
MKASFETKPIEQKLTRFALVVFDYWPCTCFSTRAVIDYLSQSERGSCFSRASCWTSSKSLVCRAAFARVADGQITGEQIVWL